MFCGSLIRSGNNAKTVKGDGIFETAIMYLAPSDISGRNVCPMAKVAKCDVACLYSAGRGAFNSVQAARIAKAQRYHANRELFLAQLVDDLSGFVAYCRRKGVKPAVRLNGTSDIQWEIGHPVKRMHYRANGVEAPHMVEYASIFDAFPEVQFYDYTKLVKRVYRKLPANYSLVLSYSEASTEYANSVWEAHIDTGCNVAVVFRDKQTRAGYIAHGFGGIRSQVVLRKNAAVIDGDRDDLRFNDPRGVIVGLYAKGKAKSDMSGFVID